MRPAILLLLLPLAALAQTGTVERRVDPAKEVLLIANETLPDSLAVAKHYCARRGVPEKNILLVKCPAEEVMSWPDFREKILKPFTSKLKDYPHALYVIPVWGVPSRISEEKTDNDGQGDPNDTIARFVTGRDYACLDAELALALDPDHEIEGWIESPHMGRRVAFTAEDRLLLVSRLDGPTPAIARSLVDKAIYAETYGVEGKNYLDTRGLDPNTAYGYTDEEMRQTLKTFELYGFPLTHEDTETEQDVSSLDDVLFYWGWYAGDYNGTRPFAFRPGAVAAHLHSCSACSVRSDSKFWVGPFLAHGVTCTTGTVFEPLTAGFPSMTVLYDRLFQGFSWAHASNMSNRTLSWMAVFVGDPLYAPFAKGMKEAQERNRALAGEGYVKASELAEAGDLDGASKLLEDIRAIGVPYEGAKDSSFLVREIAARRIAAGTGKIAELASLVADGDAALAKEDVKGATAAYEKALALSPMNFEGNLGMGRVLLAGGRAAGALGHLEKCQKVAPENPAYAEPLGRALVAGGKFKEAVPVLKMAVDAGGDAECMALLGDCYLKTREVALAIQLLTDALRQNPANRPAALTLARAHEANKDQPMAVKALLDAVKTPPADLADITAYKNAWKALELAADRAGDKKVKSESSLVVRDFGDPMFEVPTRGVALEIAKVVDDLAGDSGVSSIGNIPAEDLKVPGLPRLIVANAGAYEITLFLKGPCPRTLKLKAFQGGKPQGREMGVFPGEYEIVIVGVKGRDKVIFTGRKVFEVGKQYGMCADNNMSLAFPPK